MSEQPISSQLENIYAQKPDFLKDDINEFDPELFDRMNRESGKPQYEHGTLSSLESEVKEIYPTKETNEQLEAVVLAFTRAIEPVRQEAIKLNSKDSFDLAA